MDLADIKELIAHMKKHKIKEVDLEQEGSKVRIVAQSPQKPPKPDPVPMQPVPQQIVMPAPPAQAGSAPPPAEAPPAPAAAPAAEPAETKAEEFPNAVEIKAPMVGTFYRAPSPESPPYVDVGAVVNNDSVLCIVEAMKLMNEIKAEMRGKVLKILVENGQPIEFGQPLFLVEPY